MCESWWREVDVMSVYNRAMRSVGLGEDWGSSLNLRHHMRGHSRNAP